MASSGYSSADSSVLSTSSSTNRTTRRGRRGGRRGSKKSGSVEKIELEEQKIDPENKVEQWLNRVEEEEVSVEDIDFTGDWADEPCPIEPDSQYRPDSPHPNRSPLSSVGDLSSSEGSTSSAPQKRTRRGSRNLTFAEKAKQKSRSQIEAEYRAEKLRIERERSAQNQPKLVISVRSGRRWCQE